MATTELKVDVTLTTIHTIIRDILVAYEEETGVAITNIQMGWFCLTGGVYTPDKIRIDSEKF